MNVKLKMAMFRPIKDENYIDIYNSDYATLVYIALRFMAKNNVDLVTTPKRIYLSLSDKEPSKNDIKGIKQGLEILLENDIIYFNKNGREYIINTDWLGIDDSIDKYFLVDIEYISKVIEQTNGIKLLHYYIVVNGKYFLAKNGNYFPALSGK